MLERKFLTRQSLTSDSQEDCEETADQYISNYVEEYLTDFSNVTSVTATCEAVGRRRRRRDDSIEYDVTLTVEMTSSDDSVDDLSSDDLTVAISDIIDETDEIEVSYDEVLVDSDETETETTTYEVELVSTLVRIFIELKDQSLIWTI